MEKYSKKQVYDIIINLIKKERSLAKIGLILKNDYNIYNIKKQYNFKIGNIIKLAIPQYLCNLILKINRVKLHSIKNNKDTVAKVKLKIFQSQFKSYLDYCRKNNLISNETYTLFVYRHANLTKLISLYQHKYSVISYEKLLSAKSA